MKSWHICCMVLFMTFGCVQRLFAGKNVQAGLKKSPSRVLSHSSQENESAQSSSSSGSCLRGLIEQQVNKTFETLREGSFLGPDPDSIAQVNLHDIYEFERIKEHEKRNLNELALRIEQLKDSRQSRVIAAWLQIQLLEPDKKYWLKKLHNDAFWGLPQKQVQEVKQAISRLQKQEFALYYGIWFGFYKKLYAHVDDRDRLLPCCGNMRRILFPPDRLAQKVPLLLELFEARQQMPAKEVLNRFGAKHSFSNDHLSSADSAESR